MVEGNVFNGKLYNTGDNLLTLIKSCKGFKFFFLNKLKIRLEFIDYTNINRKNIHFFILNPFLKNTLPIKSFYENKYLLNIYILDLLTKYKGWRHSRSLPVHGQRTWSNSWNAYKLNNFLKQLRIKKGKKVYGNLPTSEIYTAQLAEQVNLVWQQQWYEEWLSAKSNRLKSKTHRNVIKTDLYSMAQGNVMSPVKFKKLSKKQQQSYNQNHFSLGFDAGFTKPLLKELYDLRSTGKKFAKPSSVILHKSDLGKKKTGLKKKKVDLKAKKAAHVAKKKSKKTVWD